MVVQTEQLLQRGFSVSRSLLPAMFSQWRLTGAHQVTLFRAQQREDPL